MGVGVLQPWHVILVLVIVLVIFGPGKLPMLGKAVGDTVRDFKKAVSDEHDPAKSSTTTVTELPHAARPCPTCQKPVAIGDRFCGACGGRTEVAAV
jgi:sec-independent protein translocase protein TatA